jgi:hypothetical protein
MKSRPICPNFNIVIRTCVAIYILIILIHGQTPHTFSQIPDISKYRVKITYPTNGEMVPVGEFTIHGTASYNATFGDCTVYADWNDLQPMQKATPAGMNYTELGRANDYSKWLFTYTDKYQVISEGENELTAKLSCDIGPFNSTKYDSVSVTGVPSVTEDLIR